MRVIAGKFRSRRLKDRECFVMRPTSDRLRETLFNILGPAVEDSLFVDLYAGTGADWHRSHQPGSAPNNLDRNSCESSKVSFARICSTLEIRSGAELIEAAGTAAASKRLRSDGSMADFIFLDPPYEKIEE